MAPFAASVVLCLGVWSVSVAGIGNSYVNEGVVFEDKGDLTFSSSVHTLVLTFDSDLILRQINEILRNLQLTIERTEALDGALEQKFLDELLKLKETASLAKLDLSNFLQSLERKDMDNPGHRQKRFSSFLGNAVGSVFGLATEEELQSIEEQVETEMTKEHRVINKLVSQALVHTKQLKKLRSATSQAQLALQALLNHVDKLDKVMANVSRELVLSQAANFFGFAINDLTNEVARIVREVEGMLGGRLSPIFLSPRAFQSMLERLLDVANLIQPPTSKNMPFYYDLARVIVRKVGTKFLFMVRIPLKLEDTMYRLYEAYPLWIAPNSSHWGRKVDLDSKYLAVRKDNKYAVTMNDMSECLNEKLLVVCPPTSQFSVPPTQDCLINLFLGQKDIRKLCRYKYSPAFTPQFRRVANHWISSLHEELHAYELCDDSRKRVVVPAGITTLKVQPRCMISATNFMLPSFQQITDPKPHSLIIFNSTHELDIPSLDSFNETLHKFELTNITEFTSTELNYLHSRFRFKTTHSHTYLNYSTLFGMFIDLVCVTLIIFVVCKCDLRRLCCPRPKTSVTARNPRDNTRTRRPRRSLTPFIRPKFTRPVGILRPPAFRPPTPPLNTPMPSLCKHPKTVEPIPELEYMDMECKRLKEAGTGEL